MEGQKVRIDGLAGSVFLPSANRDSGRVALNFPGFPSRYHATPIVSKLLEAGYAVFQPQYYGTYDSAGSFNPYLAHKTISDAMNILSRTGIRTVHDDVLIEPRECVDLVVAHSFGTYAAVRAIVEYQVPPRLLLLAPMLQFGIHARESGLVLDFSEHVEKITVLQPLTHRLESAKQLFNFYATDSEYLPDPDPIRGGERRCTVGLFAGSKDPGLMAGAAIRASRLVLSRYAFFDIEIAQVIDGAEHGVDTMLSADGRAAIESFVL